MACTTSGFGNFTLANDPSAWLDSSGQAFSASSRSAHSFSVAQQGSDVMVEYVVVAEPCLLALAAAAWAVRRRRGRCGVEMRSAVSAEEAESWRENLSSRSLPA